MKIRDIYEGIINSNSNFKIISFDPNEYDGYILDWRQLIIQGTKFDFIQTKQNNGNYFVVESDDVGEIGHVILNCDDKDTYGCYADYIEINEKYRRKGFATKLYEYIQVVTGNEVKPSPIKQSPTMQKFWANKKI
jgi:GNAT superfamily N-acetyltransferase